MINCQSIRNKKSELRECAEYIKPDIIIACESWLSSEHKNAEIFPDSYKTNVYRKDRNKNGEVFIAIHDIFTTNAVESGDNKCELAWAEVQTDAKSVIIGSFYRPPNSNPEALQELRTSIEKIKQKSKTKPIILAGDFNLLHIDWDNNTVKHGAN